MGKTNVSRTLGLKSVVFILVGYVVGASIFILPGSLGQITGPGLFISYLIAAIPALFSCAVIAQVGCAYPVSGASYVIVSRVLSPFYGALVAWLIIMLATIAIPLIALGFAEYTQYFLPNLNKTLVASLVVLLFMAINSFDVQLSSWVQGTLVVTFCVALLIFGVGGVVLGDTNHLIPLLPNGLEPVMIIAITVYFSYGGVTVLPEMAGEIIDPGRNIPLAIIIGFIAIVLIYVIVPIALMMIMPWQELNSSAAIAVASEHIFPGWLANFIAVSALFAAGTSVSGLLMAQSRDVMAAAEDGLLPKYFSIIHERTQVPRRAVILLGLLSLLGIFFGAGIKDYANMLVLGLMVLQILIGISVFRLPDSQPEVYEKSLLKYKPFWHNFFSLGMVLLSVGMFLILSMENLLMVFGLLMYLFIASMLYWRSMQRK